jgi:dynactin complex subunit
MNLTGDSSMKEGYLQGKIAELNDELEHINQLISVQEARINQLYERIGDYKDLLKKLKDIQLFKENLFNQITSENTERITERINELTKKNHATITEVLESKSLKMNEILEFLQKREKELESQKENLKKNTQHIMYLLEHNEILMMKLVNKGVLSGHDINDLEKGAKKKAGMA